MNSHGSTLPDAWLVSGCLVQTRLERADGARRSITASADYDVFYFDPDTSWEAEDAVIRDSARRGSAHLGADDRGAQPGARPSLVSRASTACPYPPLHLLHRRHRPLPQHEHADRHPPQRPSGYDVYAPNGFDDVAGLIARPNRTANFSAANYAAKAARWKALWPEITVIAADVASCPTRCACNAAAQSRDPALRTLQRSTSCCAAPGARD